MEARRVRAGRPAKARAASSRARPMFDPRAAGNTATRSILAVRPPSSQRTRRPDRRAMAQRQKVPRPGVLPSTSSSRLTPCSSTNTAIRIASACSSCSADPTSTIATSAMRRTGSSPFGSVAPRPRPIQAGARHVADQELAVLHLERFRQDGMRPVLPLQPVAGLGDAQQMARHLGVQVGGKLDAGGAGDRRGQASR